MIDHCNRSDQDGSSHWHSTAAAAVAAAPPSSPPPPPPSAAQAAARTTATAEIQLAAEGRRLCSLSHSLSLELLNDVITDLRENVRRRSNRLRTETDHLTLSRPSWWRLLPQARRNWHSCRSGSAAAATWRQQQERQSKTRRERCCVVRRRPHYPMKGC